MKKHSREEIITFLKQYGSNIVLEKHIEVHNMCIDQSILELILSTAAYYVNSALLLTITYGVAKQEVENKKDTYTVIKLLNKLEQELHLKDFFEMHQQAVIDEESSSSSSDSMKVPVKFVNCTLQDAIVLDFLMCQSFLQFEFENSYIESFEIRNCNTVRGMTFKFVNSTCDKLKLRNIINLTEDVSLTLINSDVYIDAGNVVLLNDIIRQSLLAVKGCSLDSTHIFSLLDNIMNILLLVTSKQGNKLYYRQVNKKRSLLLSSIDKVASILHPNLYLPASVLLLTKKSTPAELIDSFKSELAVHNVGIKHVYKYDDKQYDDPNLKVGVLEPTGSLLHLENSVLVITDNLGVFRHNSRDCDTEQIDKLNTIRANFRNFFDCLPERYNDEFLSEHELLYTSLNNLDITVTLLQDKYRKIGFILNHCSSLNSVLDYSKLNYGIKNVYTSWAKIGYTLSLIAPYCSYTPVYPTSTTQTPQVTSF